MNPGDRFQLQNLYGDLTIRSNAGSWHRVSRHAIGTVENLTSSEAVSIRFDSLPHDLFDISRYYVKVCEPVDPVKRECTCSSHQILWGGCNCGYLKAQKALKGRES